MKKALGKQSRPSMQDVLVIDRHKLVRLVATMKL